MFHLLQGLYFSISLAWELKFFLFLQLLFHIHLHLLRSLYLPITFFSFCAIEVPLKFPEYSTFLDSKQRKSINSS